MERNSLRGILVQPTGDAVSLSRASMGSTSLFSVIKQWKRGHSVTTLHMCEEDGAMDVVWLDPAPQEQVAVEEEDPDLVPVLELELAQTGNGNMMKRM